MALPLYTRTFGDGPPLLILHGLFGSGTNWNAIGRKLARQYTVWLVDARNHGRSPHDADMSYLAMAEDIASLIATCGCPQATIIGHSMGGKTAMTLALTQPALIKQLVVVDIAPVRYDHDYRPLLAAMRALDPATVKNRSEADARLAETIDDAGLRAFLLQNLVASRPGYRWRINLQAISAYHDAIIGFPDLPAGSSVPALFVHGDQSDFVLPEHRPVIEAFFPQASLETVAGARHWLHSEQPEAFLRLIRDAGAIGAD